MWLIVIAPLIQALWTLHPDNFLDYDKIPTYKMFPFSEVEISKPTYFYFMLRHVVMMIYAYAFGELVPKYRKIFMFWFIVQSVQFVEYFFNYNEAKLWVMIFDHRLDLDLQFLKMLGMPIFYLILQWKDRY